ncbi:MAG: hypothetical protein DYG83_12300 [Candidatus Brocadia sp. AMX2]|uniref:hypothetical protein n=1 Tax=Candidatus Brocadia sp. AMX2 TaxID=2293635 RepID=UPI00069722A7|nr:hypothetical protein [Candidatus Brocadia sp. AMX2]MBC6933273.1 hypothetical protein [Candidatus Brocadia sp.]MBL1170150.1 hypothetical protein [Candidatus Brocadia sp. AMX1]KAA0242162.1 MAG: hypothetical protein EDM70_15200 [Candidatus Brocadia sp. AMX2]MCE7867584.1 hypothetical protein [Candidatus Brocadia sp. AMX2]MCQ3918344.1 hypothetical protein [Candidatus Brocadia sp.]
MLREDFFAPLLRGFATHGIQAEMWAKIRFDNGKFIILYFLIQNKRFVVLTTAIFKLRNFKLFASPFSPPHEGDNNCPPLAGVRGWILS